VWDLGTVLTTTAAVPITFTVTGHVAGSASGELTNAITATSSTTEASPANTHDRVTTLVGSQLAVSKVVVEALYYQTYESGQPDEAVRVMNVSTVTANLGDWGLNDGGSSVTTFPPGTTLAPGQALWCTDEALAFERQFGFKPDFEVGDSDPSVPERMVPIRVEGHSRRCGLAARLGTQPGTSPRPGRIADPNGPLKPVAIQRCHAAG
jgi:hypothetical protein